MVPSRESSRAPEVKPNRGRYPGSANAGTQSPPSSALSLGCLRSTWYGMAREGRFTLSNPGSGPDQPRFPRIRGWTGRRPSWGIVPVNPIMPPWQWGDVVSLTRAIWTFVLMRVPSPLRGREPACWARGKGVCRVGAFELAEHLRSRCDLAFLGAGRSTPLADWRRSAAAAVLRKRGGGWRMWRGGGESEAADHPFSAFWGRVPVAWDAWGSAKPGGLLASRVP
jgi:hypothetical protein